MLALQKSGPECIFFKTAPEHVYHDLSGSRFVGYTYAPKLAEAEKQRWERGSRNGLLHETMTQCEAEHPCAF